MTKTARYRDLILLPSRESNKLSRLRRLGQWLFISKDDKDNNNIPIEARCSMMTLSDDILLLLLDEFWLEEIKSPLEFWEPWKVNQASSPDFVNLSSANRRLRNLAVSRLYRSLHFGQQWSSTRLRTCIQTLQASPHVHPYIQEMVLDNYTDNAGDYLQDHQNAKDLVQLLRSLPQLRRLSIASLLPTNHAMWTVCKEIEVIFSSIQELAILLRLNWLIPLCPELKNLTVRRYLSAMDVEDTNSTIKRAATASKLERLAIYHAWPLTLPVSSFVRLQNIGHLVLPNETTDLTELLPALGQMSSLRVLKLPQFDRIILEGKSVLLSMTDSANKRGTMEQLFRGILLALPYLVWLFIGERKVLKNSALVYCGSADDFDARRIGSYRNLDVSYERSTDKFCWNEEGRPKTYKW